MPAVTDTIELASVLGFEMLAHGHFNLRPSWPRKQGFAMWNNVVLVACEKPAHSRLEMMLLSNFTVKFLPPPPPKCGCVLMTQGWYYF